MPDAYTQPGGGAIAPGKGTPRPDATAYAELMYAENSLNVATGPVAGNAGGYNATPIAIPQTDLIVPPSKGRPIWLDAFCVGAQQGLGTGFMVLEFWETTGGTDTILVRGGFATLPNVNTPSPNGRAEVYHKPFRLGVVTTQRTFRLKINTYGQTAATWQAMNSNLVGFKTWARALTA